MDFFIGLVIGIGVGAIGAGYFLGAREQKFIAAVAGAYNKTVAEVLALKKTL